MKIAFFEVRPDEQVMLEKSDIKKHSVVYKNEPCTLKSIQDVTDVEGLCVFVNSVVSKEIIDSLPNLKIILTRSTGYDHIDVSYAKEKGITVSFVPSYGVHTVAEFTFALILALSRKVYPAISSVREKKYFTLDSFKGLDLYGKTLGIIGTGKIGKQVAIIANGFGMKVIATDINPDVTFAKNQNVEYLDLPVLLSKSDIISIHAPHTPSTHHLINDKNMKDIKKGALLINTARGDIVDTEILIEALQSGILSGAGLDVIAGEKNLSGETKNELCCGQLETLLSLPNVIITPHVAFFTEEAEEQIIKSTIENINQFSVGNLKNIVS